MLDEHKVDALRQYLLDRMCVISHPFDPEDKAKAHQFQNLSKLVDVWLAFLALECPEKQVEEVGPEIVQAFHDYRTAPRGDWNKAKNATKLMATRFEPFLKKVFHYRYPGEDIPSRGLYGLLVSHHNKVISLTAQPRRQPNIEFWRQQPAREAVIEKAYLLRNPAAHEARRLEDPEVSMHSILAACLFVVEENLSLLKQTVQEQEKMDWEAFFKYRRIISGSTTEAAAVEASVAEEWKNYLRYAIQLFDDAQWEEEKYLWPRAGDTDLLKQMEKCLNDDSRSVLFITGRPGAGKTAFLKRWANRLAGEALSGLEAPDSVRPETPVPLYVDLNNYVAGLEPSFAHHIVKESGLARYIRSDPEINLADPERLFRNSPVEFVVCLDALDEMKQDPERWERSLESIRRFLNAGLVSKIVVTCRDEVMPGPWRRRYEILNVAPLTLDDIHDYYYVHLGDVADAAYAFVTAAERRELLELMHIPLVLEATVEYWKQFEPSPEKVEYEQEILVELQQQYGSPGKVESEVEDRLQQQQGSPEKMESEVEGAFGNQEPLLGRLMADIFDHVLEWERSKSLHHGLDLRALEWQDELSRLAYEVDGKEYVSRDRALELVSQEYNLIRFKNMGVLRIRRHGLGFFNDLTCAYFAALDLKRTIEEVGEATLPPDHQEQSHAAFWGQCVAILQEVTLRDVSSLIQQVAAPTHTW